MDIFGVGSNLVTVTGTFSCMDSEESVQRQKQARHSVGINSVTLQIFLQIVQAINYFLQSDSNNRNFSLKHFKALNLPIKECENVFHFTHFLLFFNHT